jgi:hypothetical protein
MTDYTFRDAGLRPPLLRALNGVGRAASALGLDYPSFSVPRLLNAARQKTGLEDFGDPGFREGLEVLAEAAHREAGLHSFGRAIFRAQLLGALTGRLQIEDFARRNPEVESEVIHRPWVVLGLPRTGTTLLSLLLDLDPRLRSLRHWEATSPIPPPELGSQFDDPRIAQAERGVAQLHDLIPPLRAMHPMSATLPTECVALFSLAFCSLALETQALVPSYGRWLEGQDGRAAYAIHERVLQILQSRIPTESWALKSPQHLWHLPTLAESYPDARRVWTHRDPAKVVTSVASLNTAFYRTWSATPDPRATGSEWNRKLHLAVSRGLAFDEQQADRGWCFNLHYAELMKDPIGAVERMYDHFGDAVLPLHRRRMEVWMRDRPQDRFGRHRYDAADFGFREAALREQYAAYTERFGVAAE